MGPSFVAHSSAPRPSPSRAAVVSLRASEPGRDSGLPAKEKAEDNSGYPESQGRWSEDPGAYDEDRNISNLNIDPVTLTGIVFAAMFVQFFIIANL
eukprot:CAMPEP_0170602810 /NCGR_PEP_ID=MMETSP0224-20130122/18587_1 /TAXON_ID=285029 /ORGANISM="Togula jolla, Strain CCCM 725" /LENGTH=95 /DNA_ID=CAMNT_0010927669 /DNA_START=144 /DNA_END=431 /DNA_ORIENTATION=+